MHTSKTILSAVTAVLLLGCTTRGPEPQGSNEERSHEPPGNGSIRDLAASAMGGAQFGLPLDATLSPDGKTAYFTALLADGRPAILSSRAPSTEAPTILAAGLPLVSPLGIDISSDGETLIIADGATETAQRDLGQLLTLSVHGGEPTPLTASAEYQPRQLAVAREGDADFIYFTGRTQENEPGVFKLPLSGGAVATLSKNEPWVDPSGIAVTSQHDVYVLDLNDGNSRLLKLKGSVVSEVASGLRVGYPAGLAISQDESAILVSAVDPQKGTDAVARIDLKEPHNGTELIDTGIDKFNEPAGLKRAKNVDTYIWADSAANGSGTVFVINQQP